MTDDDLLDALRRGPRLSFADGSVAEVPSAPGVYAVWEGPALLYVGMSGRLPLRLRAHASGRRSGDQFCVYVADRLVLPELTAADVTAVGAGELSLDALTRAYVRERLTVSVAVTTSGEAARRVERMGRAGGLDVGPPLLNPISRAA